MPNRIAVVEPLGYGRDGKRQYRHVTFRELDEDADGIARGLAAMGVTPGTRLALLVRPGIDFVALVFGLFRAAVVTILIDPGMGRRNLIRCLAEAEPEGFVAVPLVHAARVFLKRRFPKARFNVTVGRRWFWGGVTLEQLRTLAPQPHDTVVGLFHSPLPASHSPLPTSYIQPSTSPPPPLSPSPPPSPPAAIIFTTGSTGPPKGVLYSHANFDAQVEQLRDFYRIQPGEVDLPAFPLFGLFNCALGVTTVIPDMDPSRPARVDPTKIVEAVRDWNVTQTFGSPAIWHRVGEYCEARGIRLATVRRVLSAGAPVPAHVLQRMKACIHPEGEIHTPYGATESLPVASISATEVLGETADLTRQGFGVCVGRHFPGICWTVIRAVDGPIGSITEVEELPLGEPGQQIGELIVSGPVVTRQYVTRTDANSLGKIPDGTGVWHRIGDVGYLDQQGRFWFCGRMAHRVLTADGPMYPIRCEAIFNQHPDVFRSALVGIGPPGRQRPVIIIEPKKERWPCRPRERQQFLADIRQLGRSNPLTASIQDVLLHRSFPVDIRHNAKIFREKLAIWAATQLGR